ncbi:MAG: hypothetical protein E7Z91_00485 [Cyanobacteria bacterium SIG30]|nr:hypothetical protein [Cyanobacteria bacterium SIG30]
MFDDEKDNENWDDVTPEISTDSDELSWDEILSDDNMGNLASSNDDDFVLDIVEGNEEEPVSYVQQPQNEIPQYIEEESDEPVIETTSVNRQTSDVTNLYEENTQNIPSEDNFEADILGFGDEETPILESQSEIPENNQFASKKPIGISQDKKSTPLVLGALVAVVVAILIGGLYLNIDKIMGSAGDETVQESLQENIDDLIQNGSMAQTNPESPELNSNPTNKTEDKKVTENKEENKKVVVNVVNTGRLNPFSPTGNFSEAGYTLPSGLDIMAPPSLQKDMPANKLVDIVVSGILFDQYKPSAIITVGGVDHFVQKGDAIDEYVVSYIGPSQVTIRSGKNTFTASIGQEFNIGDRLEGEMSFVKGKNGVTRQYFTPSSDNIENDN